MSNDDLLRPTLSAYSRPPALYHKTGFALAAFFGGPVGAAVYSLANTGRLSRLKQDAPTIVIVTATALLIPTMLARTGQFAPGAIERRLHFASALLIFCTGGFSGRPVSRE